MSNSFWQIVEKTKVKSGKDWASRPESLKSVLLELSPKEIIEFNKEYDNKLIDAYRWDLWGAAYLINGGCSDDGFDYWRDFLISEGQLIYEAALQSPDSLAELDDIEDAELEEYRYAIYEAYEQLTGDDEPPRNDIDYPAEPKGDPWDEDDLDALFPKLAKKYG